MRFVARVLPLETSVLRKLHFIIISILAKLGRLLKKYNKSLFIPYELYFSNISKKLYSIHFRVYFSYAKYNSARIGRVHL